MRKLMWTGWLLLAACGAEVEGGVDLDSGAAWAEADPGSALRGGVAYREVETFEGDLRPGALMRGEVRRTAGIWDARSRTWVSKDCDYTWWLDGTLPLSTCPSCVASFEVRRWSRVDELYRDQGTLSNCSGAFAEDGGIGQLLPVRRYEITRRPNVRTVDAAGVRAQWASAVRLSGTTLRWRKVF